MGYNSLAESVFHPEANMLGEPIEAVFEDGVFRPLGPVDLPEGTTVHVVPAPISAQQNDARRRVFEILSHSFETGDAEVAARHDEHQP